MSENNNNGLRLRLFEDNGENLYLVAWRDNVCELLCCYNPAHNGAEEVARDMRGLLDGSLKPADFEDGDWVNGLLDGYETEAERAKARKVAFEGLRGLARVWTDGRWVDWEDLADWTREVRLRYAENPQELPTADLTFGQRYDLATERIADAVLELLDHWRVKEEFDAVQGANITLDGLKVDWCWELTEGRSILSGDRIFEQLGERPFAWSRCDYVDWVRNILPPDELGRFWGEA